MPFPIKTALSIIVLLVALAAYFYQDSIGQHGPKIAIMFLARSEEHTSELQSPC